MVADGTNTIAGGQAALDRLLEHIEGTGLDWNEADTRFQIIDQLVVECLGWERKNVACEKSQNREYTDYELGRPRQAIWEAKRSGKVFDLPAGSKKLLRDLPSVVSLGGEVSKAIEQVQKYCASRGVEVAVATNGHQLVAFLATRTDGVPPLEGNCLVVDGYAHLQKQFPSIWQMLSPSGVAERRLNRFLNHGDSQAVPSKIAADLPGYRQPRYQSPLNESLRTIGELLLIDAAESDISERRFYEDCYCQSGAISQHALLSKNILSERYASLFLGEDQQPRVTKIETKTADDGLKGLVLSEALSKRPIVLLGDVGVGKSSFLKYLLLIEAEDELKDALCIYIDLGTKGALSEDLKGFVLSEIEAQLEKRYDVDILTDEFIREVYEFEISRFDRGIYGKKKKDNYNLYDTKLLDMLDAKTSDRAAHVAASIAHFGKKTRKQIVVILDNADQRSYDIQQEAFIIAENIAKDWGAVVFYAIRPSTYFKSKMSGALSAYQNRVFTIDPPRIDAVLSKRLRFALDMAEGKIEVKKLYHVQLHLSNIVLSLKALVFSLNENGGIIEFLTNISGGNVRLVIELITKFLGSSNVDAEKYIARVGKRGEWWGIPTHEFWKSALLGDYAYYDPVSSVAMNLFDVSVADSKHHFLTPLLLGYLNWEGPHRGSDGFVSTANLVDELQSVGFTHEAIETAVRRTNNKKLIEAPKRLTFAEDEAGLYGDMANSYRITTVGAYHIERWMADFSYLDAMCVDTPIFSRSVKDRVTANITSFGIEDRLNRATAFRTYLSQVWLTGRLHRPYFDWQARVQIGNHSFQQVRKAIQRDRRRTVA